MPSRVWSSAYCCKVLCQLAVSLGDLMGPIRLKCDICLSTRRAWVLGRLKVGFASEMVPLGP